MLLSKTKGKDAIRRLKQTLRLYCEKYEGTDDHGILRREKGFFDWIDQIAETYGEQIAGTAIENAQDDFNFSQKWLYYDSERYDSEQDDVIDDFLNTVQHYLEDAEEEAERLKEEQEKKAEEKAEREALYRKERKKLQRLVRSALKKGIKTVKVPKIPKKISEGSIRQISRLIESVKSKTPARRSGKKK